MTSVQSEDQGRPDTIAARLGYTEEQEAASIAERRQIMSATPAPLLAGTFAVYPTPDGGFVLVTDIPGRGEERRVVPGKIVRLVTSGVGSKMFGNLFGGAS